MNKKGFTLVELLTVIVIMSIVILIAVSGYGAISKNVKEKSYDNLVSYIETKAADYANETGNLLTNVDYLVKEGYIEADDEAGNVKSPIDGSILNCHIVSIIKEDNSLYGEYSEEEECNLDNLVVTNLNLNINVYTTVDNITKYAQIEANSWTNKNVILEATLGEKINASDVKTIIWQSNVGHEERNVNGNFESHNNYLVTAEQIVNTTYFVTIVLNDGTAYQAQVQVKIDKQRPILYEIYIERENEYTNDDKKITITASDGNGSGIYGYYVGENPNCLEVEYEENSSNTFETKRDVGNYYICVKDNAGNVAEDRSTKSIEIQYVDKVAPTCSYSGESTTWSKDDRTITLSCIDEESGCVQQNDISKTYSSNTKTEKWEYTIQDMAGNKTVCDKEVDVYVDKCTETQTEYGGLGICSAGCGGGTQTRTAIEKSTFGSGFTCSTRAESISCNTHACPPASSGEDSGENPGESSSGNSGGGGCANPGGECCGWSWDGGCNSTGGKCTPTQDCINNNFSCGCRD